MRNSVLVFAGCILLTSFFACKRNVPAKNYNDTYTSGTEQFAADESFAPILAQELYIFKNENPEANPLMLYRTENEALKLLLDDSVRFAFLSRDLSESEKRVISQRNLPVSVKKFAIDAVAIIVNQAAKDTSTTVAEIKKMLNGQAMTGRSIVFDNPNSSLVRFLKDFTGNQELKQKNIYALKSNKEVIQYVSTHPDAIGITGFSWLDDPDADYAQAVKNVRILSVKDESNAKAPNQYFKPSQTTLFLKQYPLMRSLYIVNCTGRKGLGFGLELFIEGDKGQRIILRSGLLPVILPEREIGIHSDKL